MIILGKKPGDVSEKELAEIELRGSRASAAAARRRLRG